MLKRTDPVHWTDLKRIALSPAHFLAGLETHRDTPAMRLGRLVHTIVLGGPPSAVWNGERRGNAWKEFQAANEGREIVTVAEVERATAIANAVLESPIARPYLAGKPEVPAEWSYLGRRFCTRGIDLLGDGDFLTDLKTSTCVEPVRFSRQCLRLGYHAQLAAYLRASEALGQPKQRAFIIGVETVEPYAVTVIHVGPSSLDAGERLNRLWTERLLACEAANEWPTYTQSVVELDDLVSGDLQLVIDGDEEEVAA